MELLPEELKNRLPPILSQDDDLDPMVHARFSLRGSPLVWYPIEGQPEGEDYLFFGFVLGPDAFRLFRLSELKAERSPSGEMVRLDRRFIPGRLSEIVPAPDL